MKRKVPPDGGWGWLVVAAYSLNYFVSIPVMQGFGLLYKSKFHELGFTATDISLLLNTNAAFSMFCGIINGPLIKHLGYRKVSICGAFLTTVGIILTSFATGFTHFMITYGFITSFGMGMGMSSYPVALNTYFTKRRSKAAGYTMTIAGLGPVIMPQIISLLLPLYGAQGAMLILGGIASHTFISAFLLQPVKWHMKEEIVEEEEGKEEEEANQLLDDARVKQNGTSTSRRNSLSKEVEIEAMYGIDTPLAGSMMSLADEEMYRKPSSRRPSVSSRKRTFSRSSLPDESTKPEMHLVNEKSHGNQEILNKKLSPSLPKIDEKVYNPDLTVQKKKPSLMQRVWQNIVDTFDLNLLRDPIYVNIMLGMSLAVFAELNFSLLTPFIMGDYNFTIPQTATFMSIISICDICFRFLGPFIGDVLKQPHRIMYLLSLWLLIITRFSLLLTDDYYPLLAIAAGLGIAKGVRTVFWSLVLPSHVPIERLASALGIQMTVNGICIWLGGPAIGFIRDLTGSYRKCIYIINAVTFVTISMWTVELIYVYCKKKKTAASDTSTVENK